MKNLLIVGITGRMGRIIHRLAGEYDFKVCGGIADQAGEIDGVTVAGPDDPYAVSDTAPDCIIDFSGQAGFRLALNLVEHHKIPLVSGSTGLEDNDIHRLLDIAAKVPVLLASNMSVGINLLLSLLPRVTEALGPTYDTEIVELHHNQKIDAPSGTALALAEALASGTFRAGSELVCGRNRQSGVRTDHEIGIHGVRGGDVVGDHTVYYLGPGERIEITHRAHSRETFARGALRAAGFLLQQKPGRYTMRDVLGLS